jgi:hypothetical protein
MPSENKGSTSAPPILFTGRVAAVCSEDGAGWPSVLTALSTPAFTPLAGLMVALMLLVGGLIWLAERRHNNGPIRRQGH